MQAWLCENPVGVEALQWKELPTPRAQGGRGADRDEGREPELPRPADRAEQVPGQAAAAVRAGLRVRRPRGGGGRRRDAPEARRRGCRVGAPAASPPTPSRRPRCACRCRRASTSWMRAAFSIDLRHLASRADGSRAAEGRRDRAGAGRGGRRGHRGDPDRQGGRRARHRRGVDAEKCALCGRSAPTRRSTMAAESLRDALKAMTDGRGPDVIYDPVGGEFAEPAFRSIAWRGRYLVVGFAGGPHSGAAVEPGAAQGRLAGGRVLGRLRAPGTAGVRRRDGRAGGLVCARARSSR